MTEKLRRQYPGVLKQYAFYLVFAWSIFVLVSLAWNFINARQEVLEYSKAQARILYDLNLVYRQWVAGHGGVYVPVTDSLAPNPYLIVPERDVVTTEGRKLTLINPAWMTRQVFELHEKMGNLPVRNHITSLKYVNPVNKPDAWEMQGLLSFEKGVTEVSEITSISEEPYLRLLKPFVTEEGCLKCHGRQGYRTGDIRGGISISIPMRPFYEVEYGKRWTIAVTHVMLWAFGVFGIMYFSRGLQRKEEKIIESAETYRLLFEGNPQPMWVYDLSTLSFLKVNDAAVHHYGFSRDEFLSMTIRDIRPEEDIPRLIDNVSRVSQGIDRAGIWRHKKKDGSIIFVEIISHALEYKGKPAELVLANDITERRLIEEQLRQAQKMEVVGQLAGGVAHDFNNILTAIVGYGNLMKMKMRPDDPLVSNLDHILNASEKAAGLTRSLLAFSRKQIINPRPVNLNEIINKLEALLSRLLGEDVDLIMSLSSVDLRVMADPGQIEQVLMNLAANARDAMLKGGRLVIQTDSVEADRELMISHPELGAGLYARITVVDTGKGMSEAEKGKIFEPFFTTKEVGRGTGLGLAMVYGIITQHKGAIECESRPGQGTVFRIYLPMIEA